MFNIKVNTPTSLEAFNMLAWQIKRLDWYIANNRSNRLSYFRKLNNPLINEMVNNRNLPFYEMHKKYYDQFAKKLYNQNDYIPVIEYVNKAIQSLQNCFDRFMSLQQSWGFEILPEYHVDINLFGMGGSYHRDEKNIGHIITGIKKENTPEQYAGLLGHEIIHLGIEDLVINPNHEKIPPIHQEEKERIVDNLCIYVMQGILPLVKKWSNGKESMYQEIAKDAFYMDKIVGKQPEQNLVLSVKNFLKQKFKD